MDPTPAVCLSCQVRLCLLGRFALSFGGRPLVISPAAERLLVNLAIRPGPASRHAVVAELWPDRADFRAAANLCSALCRLRGRAPDPLVTCHGQDIALAPDVSVDIHDLSGQVAASAVSDELSITALRQDVLPGWPEEWLITTREWFRQIRLRSLETLSDHHCAAGRLDAALAAVTCEPLRESAQRRLAMVHIAEGNFAEALRQYHVYRRLAGAELGLPPSPQFRSLMAPCSAARTMTCF